MAQSLARVPIHLVFSTKNRIPLLRDSIRDPLHRYMAVVMKNKKCPTILINSVEDHVHVLFELGRTVSISEAVEEIKTTSSKWLKTQDKVLSTFSWQSGYGAFAVSETHVGEVIRYIANQEEHHRKKTFQEEYLEFLVRHNIPYDDRYVWD